MAKYDFLIVGSGLYGSVFAEQLKRAGKTAIVVDKRSHIGGNCHSYLFEDTNIIVHTYGTHLFHTDDKTIWNYIQQFGEFNRYQHRVLSSYKGTVYSMPINLQTINRFYNVNLTPSEVDDFLQSKKGSIKDPQNLEEKAISLIGKDLYEAFVRGYTWKQWQCDPKLLPASIINRLPVRNSYYDSYFNDRYQGVPVEGYTPLFERMLNGIPVELNTDFFSNRVELEKLADKIVYSGAIDAYFDSMHGDLSWRSVRFEAELSLLDDFQGTSVMNYADLEIPYTRIHEPKHLHRERKMIEGKSVVIKEFACENKDEPYYPINKSEDKVKLELYKREAEKEKKVIFGGRLAQYKYLDMHQVIASSLLRVKRELR